jgi:uncharacterized protein (UPF0335 family)
MSNTGHNSGQRKGMGNGEAVAADRLRAFVQRIERLEEEKAALAADVREIYAELKGDGFDPKAIRQIVRERKQDKAALEEQQAIVELYRDALGDMASSPLGQAALERVGG